MSPVADTICPAKAKSTRMAPATLTIACDAGSRPDGSAGEEAASEPITLESERLIPALPSGREPATLTIACDAGAMRVDFAFAGQMVSATGDIAPLTSQVDLHGTSVRTLAAAPDNRSLTFSNARDTEAFLDSLIGGTNLRVRVTPVRQRSLTVDFRIDAALPQIAELRESCQPDAG
jgi:hypothetical protein